MGDSVLKDLQQLECMGIEEIWRGAWSLTVLSGFSGAVSCELPVNVKHERMGLVERSR